MGFRINTNIAAMNAHRNSVNTNLGLDKSLSSLSSGLRINKASDDASGLAIADSLHQQTQGLGQAINNVNDGIGVSQTADGALDEYINISNTIRTKAIQAASDGQNRDSRAAIQADIDRLTEEAQNIASTTSFNGQQLLNGGFQNKSFHIGAYAGETVNISIADTQTDQVGKFALIEGLGIAAKPTSYAGETLSIGLQAFSDAGTTQIGGNKMTSVVIEAGEHSSSELAQQITDALNANVQKGTTAEFGEEIGVRFSVYETSTAGTYGIRADSNHSIRTFDFGSWTGLDGITAATNLDNNFSTIDVTTQDGAEKAIITSDYTLKDLDKRRSDIGSVQNQLESTSRNISVTQVNVQAAESQIRDVDFAGESANFAKLNILAQSGSYAMSQANAVQQNILRLLQ